MILCKFNCWCKIQRSGEKFESRRCVCESRCFFHSPGYTPYMCILYVSCSVETRIKNIDCTSDPSWFCRLSEEEIFHFSYRQLKTSIKHIYQLEQSTYWLFSSPAQTDCVGLLCHEGFWAKALQKIPNSDCQLACLRLFSFCWFILLALMFLN